jgi:hypothetical protein
MTRSMAPEEVQGTTLRQDCLPYPEVLAQSVAVIAPSTVPAAIVGLIFVSAGNGTWLSFLLGMCGMMLVGYNINQFARRSASPGSLYTYIVQGLGPTAGIMGGWALMFGYTLTGMSTLCGFAIVADLLLGQIFGLRLGVLEWFVLGAGLAGYIATRNVQMSAKAMLGLEVVALLSVITLGVLIWSEKGFALDQAQLTLEGATPGGVLLGVVLVVFGFSGFESSTALGEEARDPLRSIPRSVTQSVLISGVFFVFMAYVVVFGFSGGGADLAGSEAPLAFLADRLGWGWLGTVINFGILLSFFACTLAALLTLALPAGAWLAGASAFEAQGHFGTLASFGFIAVYILITIAAPLYLRSIGKLTPWAALGSAAGLLFMAFPLLGTFGLPGSAMFPLIDFPNTLLFSVFALFMAAGFGWLMMERIRRPKMIAQLEGAIDTVQMRFAGMAEETR